MSAGSSRHAGLAAAGGVVLLLAGAQPAPADHGPTHAAPTTEADMITNALAAAPDAIARDATVAVLDAKGGMRRLREGSGPFTCIPDDPATPANDPVCVDRNGLAWLTALITRAPPPVGQIGIAYRMQGASTASNVDPFATAPAAGATWRQERPQVLILNLPRLEGQPAPGEQADLGKPWIRWAGTPYAHLVVPLY